MMRQNLGFETIVDNWEGGQVVPDESGGYMRRNGVLVIRSDEKTGTFGLSARESLFTAPHFWDTRLPVSGEEVFDYSEECRRVWQSHIVDFVDQNTGQKPFQEDWDLSNRPDLRALGARLALAGDKLFYLLFEERTHPLLELEDETLKRIVRRLREQQEMVLTIYSDDFFIPWGMLYTQPPNEESLNPIDGSNFVWEGFWGYRHIIEHNTPEGTVASALRKDLNNSLAVSTNFDEGIDRKLNVTCVSRQREFFSKLKQQNNLSLQERLKKPDLQQAIQSQDFSDQIIYFLCHSNMAGDLNKPNLSAPYLALTDGEPIMKTDIGNWLKPRTSFASNPLVFINACQGGQMTTLFYKTLAAEFLRKKAVGLIGTQVDIPAEFACAYAEALFERLFDNTMKPKVRLGPLMRDLTRYFTEKNNPLGLTYSLYRGLDYYIED